MLPAWLAPIGSDPVSVVLSALLLAGYHLYLRYRTRHHDPHYTLQAVNRVARRAWVESVMQNNRDILAVQTLRNSTMAATFLASTAVLLVIGVLTLSGQGDKIGGTWHALNVFGSVSAEIWLVKLLFLVFDLLAAFFNFTLSIRLFNHVAYQINVPLEARINEVSPGQVATLLNRAGQHYSNGMRAYYFLVPLLFWLFGPHFLLLATIGLIVFLYRIDRTPRDER